MNSSYEHQLQRINEITGKVIKKAETVSSTYEVVVLNAVNIENLNNISFNKRFKFSSTKAALDFAEICWANGYETLIRKKEVK